MDADSADITRLLKAWSHGDAEALERLTPLVYDQLLRIARRQIRSERPGQTLQSAALLHEAYLRLQQTVERDWQDRGHFFAVAAQIMRRILVDAARARATQKRGGGLTRIDAPPDVLERLPGLTAERAAELCALDDVLSALAQLDPRRARVVELRFFGGLTIEETAETLGISSQTVIRDWNVARAWLMRELRR